MVALYAYADYVNAHLSFDLLIVVNCYTFFSLQNLVVE